MPRPGDHLFVCVSQYLRPLEELDEYSAAHLEWLSELDRAGRIVATGAQEPPIGGVMVLAARDKAEVRAWLSTDPFQMNHCAAYHLHEFKLNPDPHQGRLMQHFFSQAFAAETRC